MKDYFYRLQMKAGSDGETIAEQMLEQSLITSDVEYAGYSFNHLQKGDIILIHRGSIPIALVSVKNKISEENLSKQSFGIDYSVDILSYYEDLDGHQQKEVGLWQACPPTGTFFSITNGNNTFNRIYKWYSLITKEKAMNETIKLLKYKKQIILQGPPGTGKTKKAKEIADAMIGFIKKDITATEINDDDILNNLSVGITLSTVAGKAEYEIVKVDKAAKVVTVKKATEKEADASFAKIIAFYQSKFWDSPITDNYDRRAAAIAKYIYDQITSVNDITKAEQFKLIQFHPAYTYEDFVRGISAKPNGNGIAYETEDKTLGKFAKAALENYINSKRNPQEVTEEGWLLEQLDLFSLSIEEDMNSDNGFRLTDFASIFSRDEDGAFRYSGHTWKNPIMHRMHSNDIINIYLSKANTNQDVIKLNNVSNSAKQHATYFLAMANSFKGFLANKTAPVNVTKTYELKNYVLIIDEINRANLSSVLGELIYALEYREEAVESMYAVGEGGNNLILPPNLYIIGTMNTADRSVGHIDYAIRRRFAFVDVMPDITVIDTVVTEQNGLRAACIAKFESVAKLFTKDYLNADFKAEAVQLGHSYFLANSHERLNQKLEYEVKPILKEYINDGVLSEKAMEIINGLC